jgi:DNA-binding NarL/FixJ family response regulator
MTRQRPEPAVVTPTTVVSAVVSTREAGSVGVVDELIRGREAFERSDWTEVHASLSAVSPDELGGADLVRLASAAYLMARPDECIRSLEQAHRVQLDAGDVAGAARCAFWVGFCHFSVGEAAVGAGWLSRAGRLLDDLGGDVVERGYLLIPRVIELATTGQLDEAIETAQSVEDVGRRFRDPDLIAQGLHGRGRALLYLGEAGQGVPLMDEAMTWVVAGDVSPIFAGMIYCSTVEACQEIADLGRAEQWTSALSQWCDEQPGLVAFTGQCSVHRGQIMRLHGAYDHAVEEFTLAVERYAASGDRYAAGLAHYERGEVHRFRGELAEAEEQYTAAATAGFDPQPGLALQRLAQGRTEDALAAARRLVSVPLDPVHRARFLPGVVEILVAGGDVDAAADTADELRSVAESCRSPALRAQADVAEARVLLARGKSSQALQRLGSTDRTWVGLGDRREAAVARVLRARALRAAGDEDSARLELEGARASLEQSGVVPLLEEIDQLLERRLPKGLTKREVEVLRLVAQGHSNPDIAAELFLSEKTVARHLSNIFAKLDVTSRTAAAAFAFEQHLV